MSLLTSVNEKSPGDYFFALAGSGAGQVNAFTNAGTIGTITNSTSSVSHTFPFTFQAGTYYIQASFDIQVGTYTAGDILICSLYQDGVLNAYPLTATFNPAGLASGQAGGLVISGYIPTAAGGSGLALVVGTYGVGVSSSYNIVNPNYTKVYIQKVA